MTPRQRVGIIRNARRELHDASGYKPNGIHYREVDRALNALEADILREIKGKPKWADVGPVVKGGASLLDLTPTHQTSGIDRYVATDTAWGDGGGISVYAPEAVTVAVKDTSANPGEAMYLNGASGLRYWIGHLDRDAPLGTKFAKGAFLGKTVNQAPGADHAHVGVNGEAFLGAGKQFKYGKTGNGPNYTLGSPTYRSQLAASEQ